MEHPACKSTKSGTIWKKNEKNHFITDLFPAVDPVSLQ